MTSPNAAISEEKRLAALADTGLSSPGPEPFLEDAVEQLMAICQVPIAVISLIEEDRQVFKAKRGVDLEETCRGDSFCTVTIQTPDPLTIVDTVTDERFSANPYVTGEPGIRGYLGVPIELSGGARIGALAAISQTPREWTVDEISQVRRLASMVATFIETRTALRGQPIPSAAQTRPADLDRLRTLALSNMYEGMIVNDAAGKIVSCNEAAARILGLSLDDMVGAKSIDPKWQMTDEEGQPVEMRDHPAMICLRTGMPVTDAVLSVQNPRLESRWLRINARPIRDVATGVMQYVISTFADITTQMLHVDTLREEASAARAETRTRQNFLANISHEIRTPLNGIYGMAESLHRTTLTPDQTEKVDTVLASCEGLMTLLNDILDMSKIEEGKFSIVPTEESLTDVLRHQATLWQPQANEKGIVLTLQVDDNVPEKLRFDAVRTQQCISNLLSNAIKYTKSGTIELMARVVATGQSGSTVKISVRDTGIGMDPMTIARLFRPFEQVHGTAMTVVHGTGLGLSLVAKLAELMEGEVSAESTPGRGSVFSFTFLAGAVSPGAATQNKSPCLRDRLSSMMSALTILVADDQPLNRMLCRLFLEPYGVTVLEAENGEKTLEMLKEFDIDVVLLDMHMPVMDGPDTVEAIRRSGEEWGAVPVLALTGDAMNGVREYCLSLGMDGYLTKPLTEKRFLRELEAISLVDKEGRSVVSRWANPSAA
ncbi:ATP-binding protein [Parvularcula sp. LCG005]|uniref:hybrid sensor histidine kinase/response regulator n=1 Tax=Parvularcula sp. LCG005 TaxID=3078805 RepID=UPI002941CC6D|nr:ATP-binding protein [Parvularcula sp. LCG005]WOI52761.1 response regulator [Parvularcula sp. LCG005]